MGRILLWAAVAASVAAAPAAAGLLGSTEHARGPGDGFGQWSAMLARGAGDCAPGVVVAQPEPIDVAPATDAGGNAAAVQSEPIGVAPATGVSGNAAVACRPERLASLTDIAARLRSMPLPERIAAINAAANALPYLSDKANYRTADHWATLAEFAARGGDCEDYAIAKYMLLKDSGLPAEAMRIVVVRDLEVDQPHAVLAVTVEGVSYILDNQATDVLPDVAIDRYVPVYSINEAGWWLHMPA